MKTALRISIWLNLILLSGVAFLLANQRKAETASVRIPSRTRPTAAPAPVSTPPATTPETESKPFRWSQLESSKNYWDYVANLRAIGCPEPTIQDIVRGDVARTFAWERNQLGLYASGDGPWSRQAEKQLVASLLSGQPPATESADLAAQSANNSMAGNLGGNEVGQTTRWLQGEPNRASKNSGGEIAQASVPSRNVAGTAPAYPLFLQNVNWSALGFNASQQAAIAQVRQRFLSTMNSANSNPNNSANQSSGPANLNVNSANPDSKSTAYLLQWQKALQNAMWQLRGVLGVQGWMAYEQQQYDAWYQPQVEAAADGHLTINPDAFSILQ